MERIGPYQVLEELGRGGAVDEAQAPGQGGVAVKVLLQRRGPFAQRTTRFEGEARARAKVDQRDVVRLLDVGEHRGAPYVVTTSHSEGSLASAAVRAAW